MVTIKVLVIDEKGATFIEVPNVYEELCKLVNWKDAWNTPTIRIEGHEYIVICSDTGKLRHEKISCMSIRNVFNKTDEVLEPFMVGSIIITKFDGVDDFATLNDEDVNILKHNLFTNKRKNLNDFFETILFIDN